MTKDFKMVSGSPTSISAVRLTDYDRDLVLGVLANEGTFNTTDDFSALAKAHFDKHSFDGGRALVKLDRAIASVVVAQEEQVWGDDYNDPARLRELYRELVKRTAIGNELTEWLAEVQVGPVPEAV